MTYEHTLAARVTHLERWLRSAVVGYLILLIGFGTNLYVSKQEGTSARHAIVQTGNAVSVSGCNRDYKQTTALRSILRTSKDVRKRNGPPLSPEQQKASDEFFNLTLGLIPLPDCRPLAHVVSDSTKEPVRIPTPLYPKPKG